MKPLSIENSSFKDIIASNMIYVDKTDMIYSLAKDRRRIFLSRPRRFGKSLLVSTFESLFRYGLRDFKGLAIEPLWNDTTYTTISLDFSCLRSCSTIERFRELFLLELKKGLPLSEESLHLDPSDAFGLFLDKKSKTGEQVVLLIDEYDSPLSTHMDSPELFDAILQELDAFYAQMKRYDSVFRFVFITGIAKFGKASVFSMLNHVTDISQDPQYGTLLGYTEEEIRDNLAEYLAKAAKLLHTDEERVMNQIRAHYDGFCFERTASKHVYTPWSVLQFFASPEQGYINYWADSAGKPTALINYLREHPLGQIEDFEDPISVQWRELARLNTMETLQTPTFLFQTGYLSIVGINAAGNPLLGLSNLEVRSSMAEILADTVFLEKANLSRQADRLFKVLHEKDTDGLIAIFRHALANIAYDNYPITTEATLRALIQFLFVGAGISPAVEKHTSFGRTDMQFTFEDTLWVFEFKYRQINSESIQSKLKQAEEQILKRHYGEEVDKNKRVRVAIVFDEESRNFVDWKSV